MSLLQQIANGRTDVVFDYVNAGQPADSADQNGVSLIQWCAYYGDVSSIQFLLARGESLNSLGENLGLSNACFHGHWRLCQFLLEHGADVNCPHPANGETPLHSALCKDWPECALVVKVLLAHGADPNVVTKKSAETGAFMRDVRTRGETSLHRAAAFADEETIQLLLNAGAALDAKDMNGDSPLTWASWHLRPTSILRKLCYGDFRINPDHADMKTYLRGKP
jgi:uncharacterized protein